MFWRWWDIWLIFLVLGVFIPWRGRKKLQELLSKGAVSSRERLALYSSTIAFQWIAAAIAAWRAWAHGLRAAQLGLTRSFSVRLMAGAVLGAVAFAVLQWLNLRRVGRMPVQSRGRLQALAQRILPQSRAELVAFLALALTAGICEEFLYRGFTMAIFSRAGLPPWCVVLFSAVLFGLAHLYQGRAGFVSTMVLGGLFGAARIAYDSLLPVVLWHAAVDVVAGVAGSKYLAQSASGVAAPDSPIVT